jgi:hypothetical protein
MKSNKKNNSFNSHLADNGWGIGTVTLAFEVEPSLSDLDSPLWLHRTKKMSEITENGETFIGLLPSEHANVRVFLDTGNSVCSIHFNATDLAFGERDEPLHPGALEPMVEGIVNALRDSVWPAFDRVSDKGDVIREANWADQIRVQRLDMTGEMPKGQPSESTSLFQTTTKNNQREEN